MLVDRLAYVGAALALPDLLDRVEGKGAAEVPLHVQLQDLALQLLRPLFRRLFRRGQLLAQAVDGLLLLADPGVEVLGGPLRRFLTDSPFPFQQFFPGGELGVLAGLVRPAQFLQQPLQLFAELRLALLGVGGLAAQAVGLELRGLSRPLGLQLGGLPGLVQFQPGGLTLTRKPKVGLLTFRSHGVLHGLFQPRLGKGVVLPAKRLRLLRPGPQELVVDLVLYGVGYLKGLSAVRADDGGDVHVLAPIPSRLLTHRLICISVGLSAANIRLPL